MSSANSEPLYTFDEASLRKLAALVHAQERQLQNLRHQLAHAQPGPALGREIRVGRTTTWPAKFPVYPVAPANTYVVQFQDWTFTEVPGQQTLVTKNWAQRFEIALFLPGDYLEENTLVALRKHHGRWLIDCVLDEEEAAHAIDLAATCMLYADWTLAEEVENLTRISVNHRASLLLWKENEDDQSGLLDIGGAPTGHVFTQPAGGREPRWWGSPQILRSLQAGCNGVDGFLQLGDTTRGFVRQHNPSTGGKYDVIWPTEKAPEVGAHLYVNARTADGSAVQLEWVQGYDSYGYGYFGPNAEELEPRYFEIHKGLLWIDGLSYVPDAGEEPAPDTSTMNPFNPCTDPETGTGGSGSLTARVTADGKERVTATGADRETEE